MGRKKKELLPIMIFIMNEISYNSEGIPLKSFYESGKEKPKFKKNYIIQAYKTLQKQGVIDVLKIDSGRGRRGMLLKLSENTVTKKIDQINYWIKLFTEQQKPIIKKLKKSVIILEHKNKKDNHGYSTKYNPAVLHDLRTIGNQMSNLYRHFSALRLAFDLKYIPKVYEKMVEETQKSGIKFIKNSIKRVIDCEKKYPQDLKRYLITMFATELMELDFYEQFHESKKY